jgi:hypothetical protein
MVRERESHASRLFIEITPGIRRALEMLAEASIDLLNEIDAPLDGLEVDPDFELLAEDDEDGGDAEDLGEDDEDTHDAEPEEGNADLGWPESTVASVVGDPGCDDDFVTPETSGGLMQPANAGAVVWRAAQRALFDPRLARRPKATRCGGDHPIPPFPHEAPDRPALRIGDEMQRLTLALAALDARRRRVRRQARRA